MVSLVPYLDAAGFLRRTVMAPSDVALVQSIAPGYLETSIADRQSEINNRLMKRYGTVLPFGQVPAQPTIFGGGPTIVLSGQPAVGSLLTTIEITADGGIGVGTFRWSLDGGQTWTTGVVLAASVALGATGISSAFPAASYVTGQRYAAPAPVDAAVLRWLAAFVTIDMYDKRGRDAADPLLATAQSRFDRADAQLKESADGEGGYIEIPLNDAAANASAVVTGGPFSYSEPDSYSWMDQQAEAIRGCR